MKNIVKFVLPLILVIAIPLILFIQKNENEIEKYNNITQSVFNEFHPTGISLAIVQDGEIIYQKALGYKNASNINYLDHYDIFNIASCTKAFTAAGIGKLVEDGLLTWEDKVIDYIPNFKLADEYITQNLNLKDMLSHRTGLGTFYGDLLWYNTTYTNTEVIERMQYLPITKDFRTGYGYQNNMYMIAGEIIKSVTGQSWEEYIINTFLEPLDMSDTRTSSDQFDGTEEIAFPHFNDSIIGLYYFQSTKPAASIWSNPRDLANWATMLLNNGEYKGEQILSKETVRTLMTAQIAFPVSEERESFGMHFRNYALGWSTYDYNGRKIVEHNGGMPGYISKVALIPEENMAVIILNNGFETTVNTALFYSIVDIATNQFTNDWIKYYSDRKLKSKERIEESNKKRIATKDTEIKPSLELTKYTGIFNDRMYGAAEIKIENNELICTLLPAHKVFTSKLESWNGDTFKVVFKDPFLPFGLVTFEINDSNKVIGFKIDLPSNDFHFKNLNFKKTN